MSHKSFTISSAKDEIVGPCGACNSHRQKLSDILKCTACAKDACIVCTMKNNGICERCHLFEINNFSRDKLETFTVLKLKEIARARGIPSKLVNDKFAKTPIIDAILEHSEDPKRTPSESNDKQRQQRPDRLNAKTQSFIKANVKIEEKTATNKHVTTSKPTSAKDRGYGRNTPDNCPSRQSMASSHNITSRFATKSQNSSAAEKPATNNQTREYAAVIGTSSEIGIDLACDVGPIVKAMKAKFEQNSSLTSSQTRVDHQIFDPLRMKPTKVSSGQNNGKTELGEAEQSCTRADDVRPEKGQSLSQANVKYVQKSDSGTNISSSRSNQQTPVESFEAGEKPIVIAVVEETEDKVREKLEIDHANDQNLDTKESNSDEQTHNITEIHCKTEESDNESDRRRLTNFFKDEVNGDHEETENSNLESEDEIIENEKEVVDGVQQSNQEKNSNMIAENDEDATQQEFSYSNSKQDVFEELQNDSKDKNLGNGAGEENVEHSQSIQSEADNEDKSRSPSPDYLNSEDVPETGNKDLKTQEICEEVTADGNSNSCNTVDDTNQEKMTNTETPMTEENRNESQDVTSEHFTSSTNGLNEEATTTIIPQKSTSADENKKTEILSDEAINIDHSSSTQSASFQNENKNDSISQSPLKPDTDAKQTAVKAEVIQTKIIETLSDITEIESIKTLSIRVLKELLKKHNVQFTNFSEKSEFVERVEHLWKDSQITAKDVSEENLCKICRDAPMDCILLECGHIATCTDCASALSECPICRLYIVKRVRVFRT